MTHIRSHSSQKWSGDWNLGDLISLSRGILSRDCKGMKKQGERKGAHQQKRNVTRFKEDRKQPEVLGLALNSKSGQGSLKDLQRDPQSRVQRGGRAQGGVGMQIRSGKVRTEVSPSLNKTVPRGSLHPLLPPSCFPTQISGCPTFTHKKNRTVQDDCPLKELDEASGTCPGCWCP